MDEVFIRKILRMDLWIHILFYHLNTFSITLEQNFQPDFVNHMKNNITAQKKNKKKLKPYIISCDMITRTFKTSDQVPMRNHRIIKMSLKHRCKSGSTCKSYLFGFFLPNGSQRGFLSLSQMKKCKQENKCKQMVLENK